MNPKPSPPCMWKLGNMKFDYEGFIPRRLRRSDGYFVDVSKDLSDMIWVFIEPPDSKRKRDDRYDGYPVWQHLEPLAAQLVLFELARKDRPTLSFFDGCGEQYT